MVYVGIYGGLFLGLLGWYLGRAAARKNRGLDEMNAHIWSKARSTSWYFTAASIYLLMTLELTGIKLNLIPALSILLFVHLASWAVAGAIYSFNLIRPSSANKAIIISTIIASTLFVFFVIISAITENWKFLFAAIPPLVMNIVITTTQARKAKDSKNK